MKDKINRSDALKIFSIMYGFSKTLNSDELNLLCDLALEKEKLLSSDKDKKLAQKKVTKFFKDVPGDLDSLNENDGRLTILMFLKSLVIYIAKYRGGRFFYLEEILNKINKEIENIDGEIDKSDILTGLLKI